MKLSLKMNKEIMKMKRLIVPIILLVLFVFAIPCSATSLTNLFDKEMKVPVDSEIDPWDLFFIKNDELECKWEITSIFPCPQGDIDTHIVITNPDPKAKIDKIELVISTGGFLPFGTLCSYSYMKDGEWHMFLYDFNKKRFVRYEGEHGHGGSVFGRNQ